MKRFAALILICSLAVASPSADNWPQFSGPQGGVVADDPDLPESWSQVDEQRATSATAGLQNCRR